MIMNTVQTGMLHTNCYLLGDEKLGEGILFDPGASTQKILDMIEQSGVKIKYIVLTHCHFDHVMAAPSIQDATGAELMIHKEDAPYLTPEYVSRKGYIRETYKTPRIDRILEDGDTITLGGIAIKVMNTPGHTRGSCVFMLHDAERGDIMLSGDTLFKDACGRWDLEGGSQESMMESLRRLYAIEGDYAVFSGHGAPTTLQAERENNPYMKMAVNGAK